MRKIEARDDFEDIEMNISIKLKHDVLHKSGLMIRIPIICCKFMSWEQDDGTSDFTNG